LPTSSHPKRRYTIPSKGLKETSESSGPIPPRLRNRDSDHPRTIPPNLAGSGGSGKSSLLGWGPKRRQHLGKTPPRRTPVNHKMANNPKCTDTGTSIAGDEREDQFPVIPTSRFPRMGVLEAGVLQTKLEESGKRNLGSPFQDKKDVLFPRSTLNEARALLGTALAELREFDSKGGSREWASGIVVTRVPVE